MNYAVGRWIKDRPVDIFAKVAEFASLEDAVDWAGRRNIALEEEGERYSLVVVSQI